MTEPHEQGLAPYRAGGLAPLGPGSLWTIRRVLRWITWPFRWWRYLPRSNWSLVVVYEYNDSRARKEQILRVYHREMRVDECTIWLTEKRIKHLAAMLRLQSDDEPLTLPIYEKIDGSHGFIVFPWQCIRALRRVILPLADALVRAEATQKPGDL